MDIVNLLVQQLSPEQRAALLQQLLPSVAAVPTTVVEPPPAAAPTPRTPAPRGKKQALDMSTAQPISFIASLSANERARDQTWAQRFDHVWFKGHYQVKGPKGGMYCLGRAVLGNRAREQYKGTLKISNKAYLQLAAGEAVDGWFIPDDTKDNVFIGTLSNLQRK